MFFAPFAILASSCVTHKFPCPLRFAVLGCNYNRPSNRPQTAAQHAHTIVCRLQTTDCGLIPQRASWKREAHIKQLAPFDPIYQAALAEISLAWPEHRQCANGCHCRNCKKEGKHKLTLSSNHQLTSALRLYESMGFTYTTCDTPHFELSDIYMELLL